MDHLGLVKTVDGLGERVVVSVTDTSDGWFDAAFSRAVGVFVIETYCFDSNGRRNIGLWLSGDKGTRPRMYQFRPLCLRNSRSRGVASSDQHEDSSDDFHRRCHRNYAVRRRRLRRSDGPNLNKHSTVLDLVQDKPALCAGAASGILDKICVRHSAGGRSAPRNGPLDLTQECDLESGQITI
jgi:hypothetical protein